MKIRILKQNCVTNVNYNEHELIKFELTCESHVLLFFIIYFELYLSRVILSLMECCCFMQVGTWNLNVLRISELISEIHWCDGISSKSKFHF